MLDIAATAYQDFKLVLLDATGLSRDALHIHFGIMIVCAVRLLWRGSWRWPAAWLGALAFALTGEVFDWHGEEVRGFPVPLGEHWHDIWNTMLWPTVFAIAGWRLDRRAASEPLPSGEDAEQPLEQA